MVPTAKQTSWAKLVLANSRPAVREGGTGGLPPVNFGQYVAATRPAPVPNIGNLLF